MNDSTGLSNFEKMLENKKAHHRGVNEKEMLEKIDFLEKNKVGQSVLDFLQDRVWDCVIALILVCMASLFGLYLGLLTNLLFHSVITTCVLSVLGTFPGGLLSICILGSVKINARDKGEIKKLKEDLSGKSDFFDESFLSSIASPELIVAFEKEMGRQYLIELYVANNGEDLTNGMLVEHFNKKDKIKEEETKLRILYEDCIKKVEDKHLLCAK